MTVLKVEMFGLRQAWQSALRLLVGGLGLGFMVLGCRVTLFLERACCFFHHTYSLRLREEPVNASESNIFVELCILRLGHSRWPQNLIPTQAW